MKKILLIKLIFLLIPSVFSMGFDIPYCGDGICDWFYYGENNENCIEDCENYIISDIQDHRKTTSIYNLPKERQNTDNLLMVLIIVLVFNLLIYQMIIIILIVFFRGRVLNR